MRHPASAGLFGLAAKPNCANEAIEPTGDSYVTYGQGTGPNAGIRYVVWHAYRIEMANNLHPGYRQYGGTTWTVNGGSCNGLQRSNAGYNSGCQSGPYYWTWAGEIQRHEDEHFQQAVNAKPTYNLPAQIEELLGHAQFALETNVVNLYNLAHQHIWNQVLAIDGGTMGRPWKFLCLYAGHRSLYPPANVVPIMSKRNAIPGLNALVLAAVLAAPVEAQEKARRVTVNSGVKEISTFVAANDTSPATIKAAFHVIANAFA
ncbi:MAG TPA: hypothetical protein VMM78_05200, partial [Thermomicrobiales bacterium]|nr:hypothetical protein [Thermomicrobiales bacterium]